MEQRELDNKKKDKGFTLIELLIVIVILGILATVVVFAVSGIRDQGDESACATEKRTLQTAIEAYYAQVGEGSYPETEADLGTLLRTELQYFTFDGDGESYPTVTAVDGQTACSWAAPTATPTVDPEE